MEILRHLFSSGDFMPHGYCYLWNPGLVWLHVVSDALIALAYMVIPFALVNFVRKRRDLPFSWMFVCFGVFIVACGLTHVMEVWNLWRADYWLAGAVKVVTAAASVPTAVLLVQLVPKALELPSPADWQKANEELRKSEQQFRRQAELLELANGELEAFTYSVSHDLRAPVRHIDGFSRILLEEHRAAMSPETQRYLERVLEAAQQMGRLVDDLLNLSRIGRKELARRPVNLNALVESALADLRSETADRKIDWRIGRLPTVEGDAGLLKLVFANLLSNAVKFTRDRECAVIEVGEMDANGQPAIFVRDNGAGFPMKYAHKLFGVFQRLHRQEDFKGTGVGLATVQRIVRRHGGQVWAEAEPDRGATFYFTLGAAQPRGTEEDSALRGLSCP